MDVRAIQAALCAARYSVRIDGELGPETYGALFGFVGRTGRTTLTTALGEAAAKYFPMADLGTPFRIGHALAQWAVETRGFRRLEEDLDYSAGRLTEVWPKRFPTVAAALPYAGHPQALANRTYGGRFGNTAPNDGWKYRGRGPTQLTFHDNYAEASHVTGLDLVSDPDAVAEPDTGMFVACAYWVSRKLNAAADRDDIAECRLRIQGGDQGLDDARRFLARANIVLR